MCISISVTLVMGICHVHILSISISAKNFLFQEFFVPSTFTSPTKQQDLGSKILDSRTLLAEFQQQGSQLCIIDFQIFNGLMCAAHMISHCGRFVHNMPQAWNEFLHAKLRQNATRRLRLQCWCELPLPRAASSSHPSASSPSSGLAPLCAPAV